MMHLKQHFLIDPSITFLNHGSFGATPKPVFEEYQRWQRELETQPVEFLGRRLSGLMSESRAILGEYLGTHPDNLVYTQNVTISLNIVARSMKLGSNDEVLTTDHEYGAMDRTWQFLSGEHGFRYIKRHVKLPLTTEEKFIEDFWAGVTDDTRIIFLSQITSPTAIIFPVKEIVRRAREAGIITVIDGAHVAGQIPSDLDSLGADFYGGNLHKWLCAPKGAGFLYARPEMQTMLKPLVVSWGDELEFPSRSTFVNEHEFWGTRDVSAFLAVPSAIKFQDENNWDEVRDSCHQIAAYTQKQISELTGISALHPQTDIWFRQMAASPLPADTDVNRLKNQLYDEYRIEVPVYEWSGNKLIRVSVQGYNTKQDVDKLIHALSILLAKQE